MKKIEEQRFEFLLYINGNIICQRYFIIKGYNPTVLKSMEIKELIDTCTDFIKNDLKAKSEDYLWGYFNPYGPQKVEEVRNIFDNEDIFEFEIRVDKRSVAKTAFTGNVYPPKVRYSVNIKELIPGIIAEIQSTFSKKKYTTNYADVAL